MEKNNSIKTISTIISIFIGVLLASIFQGIIIWLIWPIVARAFSYLVLNGFIPEYLTLGQSICISWLFNILFKSYNFNK